jgi:hypothetical protein
MSTTKRVLHARPTFIQPQNPSAHRATRPALEAGTAKQTRSHQGGCPGADKAPERTRALARVRFKPIPGFPQHRAGKDGSIWSIKSGKWRRLKPHTGNHGYQVVNLGDPLRGQYGYLVHRLILLTFRGACPQGQEARHLDGDRQNCRLRNLKWGTRSENRLDTVKHGRGRSHRKLTAEDVINMRWLKRMGLTHEEIAKDYPVTLSTAINAINGYTWKMVS